MNRPSLDVRGSLALFSLLLSIVSAVPFVSDDRSWMTAAPELLGRDVQSICGFWTDVVTTSDTWSYWCYGLNCAVDVDVTPQIVFCSTEDFVPYTTYYSYGQWPAGGCQYRQSCCPSNAPKVRTHTYNNGASLFMECAGADANITDGSQDVYTQLGEYSAFLAPYTTTSTPAAVPKTTASPADTVAVVSATSTQHLTTQPASPSATSLPSSFKTSLPSSLTTSSTSGVVSSLGQSTISQTTTVHTTSSTATAVPQSDTLGFKIGLGAGLGLGIPLVLVAGIFAGMWTMRRSRGSRAPVAEPVPVATPAVYELGSSRPWDELDSKHMVVKHNALGRSELDSSYRPYELDSTG